LGFAIPTSYYDASKAELSWISLQTYWVVYRAAVRFLWPNFRVYRCMIVMEEKGMSGREKGGTYSKD